MQHPGSLSLFQVKDVLIQEIGLISLSNVFKFIINGNKRLSLCILNQEKKILS